MIGPCNAADRIQAKVKALIDLEEPFVSLENTGNNLLDANIPTPYANIPLMLLAYLHSQQWGTNLQMADKVGLLLTRGANVKARNSSGGTCLHLVFLEHHHRGGCWLCCDGSRLRRHLCRTKDIVILMITAGADVCAVDGEGESVSDVAIRSGQQSLWTEALKYCGIDINDVLARSKVDTACSTALSPEYSQPPRSVTSKMSLEEYLERRKAFCVPEEKEFRGLVPIFDSSEDDDSGDEESNSGLSPSKHDKNEDEDWIDEASEIFEVDEQESDNAQHEAPIQYEPSGKAKLE